MTSQAAKDLRDKLAASQKAERMGATFRAFAAACGGGPLIGIFYELPLAERMDWQERARKAAVALGMVLP